MQEKVALLRYEQGACHARIIVKKRAEKRIEGQKELEANKE